MIYWGSMNVQCGRTSVHFFLRSCDQKETRIVVFHWCFSWLMISCNVWKYLQSFSFNDVIFVFDFWCLFFSSFSIFCTMDFILWIIFCYYVVGKKQIMFEIFWLLSIVWSMDFWYDISVWKMESEIPLETTAGLAWY